MKRFNYISSLVLMTMIFMASCAEKERIFPEFENLEKGAFARLVGGAITGPNGQNFNYFDVNGSNINIEVEFYDENQGKNVESYTIDVAHAPTNKKAQIAQTTSANFGTSVNGLPNAKYKFTFAQVLTTLGITYEQVKPGDRFVFNCAIKMKDGRIFNATNSAAALDLPAFANLRQFNVNIICPSSLGGKDMPYTSVGWCGSSKSGILELRDLGNGVYNIFVDGGKDPDFSFGAYYACYSPTAALPLGTLRLNDACNKLAFSGASQWGETYKFNSISVSGKDLTLDWVNDYAEGAVTTITRVDGKDWPPLVK